MSPPIDALQLQQIANPPQVRGPAQSTTDNSFHQRRTRQPQTPQVSEVHKEQIQVDEKLLALGFSVDHSSNAIKIRITNQNTGELVREFELKGLNKAHAEPRTKGVIVDDQT